MNIIEATKKAISEKKNIARKDMLVKFRATNSCEGFIAQDMNNTNNCGRANFNIEDIIAEDWEVIE